MLDDSVLPCSLALLFMAQRRENESRPRLTRRSADPRLAPLAAFAALGVFWGIWSAALPGVSRGLGIGDAALGLALLCVAAGALPAMILAGQLVDRAGPGLLAWAVAAFGICSVLPGLAPNVVWLGVALLAVGMASGGLDVVMNAAAAQVEAAHGRRVMHLAHATFSASLLVASVLAGFGRDAGLSYAVLLWIGAAVILVMAVLVRSLSVAAAAGSRVSSGEGTILSLRNIPLLAVGLGALCALAYLVENGLQLWGAQHLERTLGSSPAISGLGPGVFAASAVVGRLAGQLWAARLGERRLLVLAGLGAAAGAFVFAFAPNAFVALIGLALAGGAVSVAAPTLFALAGRTADPRRRGAAISGVAIIGYLGFLVGPALLGAVSGALGLRDAIVTVGLVAVAFAVLSGLALNRLKTARIEHEADDVSRSASSIHGSAIELQGQTLRLEPLEERHADALFEGLSDKLIYRFVDEEPPRSLAALRERYRMLQQRRSPDGSETWLNWAIWSLTGEAYLGYVQATIKSHRSASIAYVIFPDAWGKGVATEAVSSMMRELVRGYGVHDFAATVDERNAASIALLRRLGFKASEGDGGEGQRASAERTFRLHLRGGSGDRFAEG